jgi:hypothetical protein
VVPQGWSGRRRLAASEFVGRVVDLQRRGRGVDGDEFDDGKVERMDDVYLKLY